MMSDARKPHTDREYEVNLQAVRRQLVEMCELVQQMIPDALHAFENRDVELARRTMETDHRVNRYEVETDEICLLILAKWKPLASDLRFMTLALKMVTDLERIGDLAVNICKCVAAIERLPRYELEGDFPQMVKIVRSMVGDSVSAFIEGDADKAHDVLLRDNDVDDLYDKIFRQALTQKPEDTARLEWNIHVIDVAQWVERMGDHATNLAEQVIFMVKGKDVRHLGKLDRP